MESGDIGDFLDENWYGGEIDGDFYEHSKNDDICDAIDEESPRPQKKQCAWDWQYALSRALMSGRHTADILSQYGDALEKLGFLEDARAFLEDNDGWLGYFVVDVSCFDSKFGYKDIPDFMRSCNLFAVNSRSIREVVSRSLVSDSAATVDGYLSSEDGVSEEVYYVDETTGLPCLDDNSVPPRDLFKKVCDVANFLFGRKILTEEELSRVESAEETNDALLVMCSAVQKSFKPSARGNSEVENVVDEFEIKPNELTADSASVDAVEIKDEGELKLDDIGEVSMDESLGVENDKEFRIDDIGEVSAEWTSEDVDGEAEKLDDIGEISFNSDLDAQYDDYDNKQVDNLGLVDEFDSPVFFSLDDEEPRYDETDDVELDNEVALNNDVSMAVDALDEIPVGRNVEIDNELEDELYRLDDSDYEDDVEMEGELAGEVDLNEMIDQDSDKKELDVETPVRPYAVSNDFDWTF